MSVRSTKYRRKILPTQTTQQPSRDPIRRAGSAGLPRLFILSLPRSRLPPLGPQKPGGIPPHPPWVPPSQEGFWDALLGKRPSPYKKSPSTLQHFIAFRASLESDALDWPRQTREPPAEPSSHPAKPFSFSLKEEAVSSGEVADLKSG